MSVPNQKCLIIVKPQTTTPPFLQVNGNDWREAFTTLSPSAFGIYLYLAENANGYNFEFSPTAIANTGIMSKGTATKARQELELNGYIEGGCFYVESKQKREQRAKMVNEINKTTST